MRLLFAIIVGKIISKLIKLFRLGGGSAAPGLYALKIDPDLVSKLVQKIPKNVIITGTNGKTTTARMLSHFAKESGLKVIRNHTGSNLERGVASTLLLEGGLRWYLSFNIGVWELDEAAFNTVAPKMKPDVVVFLNIFRDQLDRYGEVDSVIKRWCSTLTTLKPQTSILVNGDDTNTAKLTKCFKGETLKFGVKDYKIFGEAIEYQKEQENLDFEAKNVKLKGLKGSKFELTINRHSLIINLPLPGIYHIYDFLAAFAVGYKLGISEEIMIRSLKNYSPAFGRVERLPFGYIFLIKNPAGATQVFETIAPNLKQDDRLLFALNDNIADGTDVSWIWDGEWERLQVTHQRRGSPKAAGYRLQIIVSGTRAYDLAVRLKYAGFDPQNIIVEPSLKKALQRARKDLKGHLFILPTYTAMLELQRILAKMGLKRHYWEEE